MLPVRFPKAVNGKDLVVLESRNRPPVRQAITVYGRDAMVNANVRNALAEQWPDAFDNPDPV